MTDRIETLERELSIGATMKRPPGILHMGSPEAQEADDPEDAKEISGFEYRLEGLEHARVATARAIEILTQSDLKREQERAHTINARFQDLENSSMATGRAIEILSKTRKDDVQKDNVLVKEDTTAEIEIGGDRDFLV